MTILITGNFQQQDSAQKAIADLKAAGFPQDGITTFFVNPAGQHDLSPIGGDEQESPGTEDSPAGSATGAAVGGAIGAAVGLATLPVLGPAGLAAGGGVGAYVGSLYGALGSTEDKTPDGEDRTETSPTGGSAQLTYTAHPASPPTQPTARKSGVLVAVAAPTSAEQEAALRILRAHCASELEQTQGTLVAGEWTDFSALDPVHVIP